MKISSVKSKFVVSQMRLDGSFHLSDGLEVRKLVSKSPYGTTEIKDVSSNSQDDYKRKLIYYKRRKGGK